MQFFKSSSELQKHSFWQVFFFLLLINLISNVSIFFINNTLMGWLCLLPLAVFTAIIETFVWKLISGIGKSAIAKIVSRIYLWIIALFYNVMIVMDYFLLIKFKAIYTLQTLDLIIGTNPSEAAEFFGSYVPLWIVVLCIAALILVNWGIWRISGIVAHSIGQSKTTKIVTTALSLAGAAILGYMCVMFVRFNHGMQIPTFTSPTRVAYSVLQYAQSNKRTAALLTQCRNAEVGESAKPEFDIVIVLGESFNRSHSPLYGYDKNTTPGLKQLYADSMLVVFEDVVTVEDWTQKVLMSLLSTGSGNESFGSHPLFPVLFRKAGWNVELYDNEFLATGGSFFYSDKNLSELMFDTRNEEKTRYDGELADMYQPTDRPTLAIIHLMGQHFTYSDRYPESFNRFKSTDYDSAKYNERQRDILAKYDNATLYNDSVVTSVMQRVANRNAIVFYFPDHGEEIYDCRDYYGHGNAISAPDITPQISIPFFVYTTTAFRQKHPEIQTAIDKASKLPIITDDFAQMMLHLAGISTPELDLKRSFLSDQYDKNKPRLVLKNVDFNNYKATTK